MDLREGTRRLALFLGVLGAVLGGFASYLELQTALSQRARHNRFEQLTASDLVQQERKCRSAGIISGCSDLPAGCSIKPLIDPRTGERIEPSEAAPQIAPKAGEEIDLSASSISKRPGQVDYDALAKKYGGTSDQKREHGPWEKYAARKTQTSPPPPDTLPADFTDWDSVVNRGGIKTINWSQDYRVDSITTDDGLTLFPAPAPAKWSYIFVALYPLLGFFAPWGATRAIGWVGAGFFQTPK